MKKYYKTAAGSETGKKFAEIAKRAQECHEACVVLANKYKFEQWRSGLFAVYGGISSCHDFEEGVDLASWKKSYDGYMPKLNTKVGKEIKKELDRLPRVSIKELNMCIGWDERFSHIGFTLNDKEFFGFIVDDELFSAIPDDCEEITASEYQKLENSPLTPPLHKKRRCMKAIFGGEKAFQRSNVPTKSIFNAPYSNIIV